ncbi:electron transfer flavoprotein alpha subunit apoprotein [Paraburkholderia sp. BL18I3N2]|uniref:electron transfer flavoprotein subunit alpha/FixB family protein n=1 Tax=Paraburkholderia sp. BL18I3N2 TaxID=1938799 RepID=UPI000D07F449|nr:FAD-binding protein [Paraburkholderia sp. BL18I3N2]PRX27396.1 electron transfer flavoprotein alpha subunit apoprotein [Paraburkholderia sp. BL18I3N2]
MTTLVIAEHDGHAVKNATLHAINAAQKIGGEIHVLVAGHEINDAVQRISRIAGVDKVLTADAPHLADGLAENLETMVLIVATRYSHILAAATTQGKNLLPRIAARLDVVQISDVTAVLDKNTYERPIYAGNAISTVRSLDGVKVLTIRTTAFDAVPHEGGNASIEKIEPGPACPKVRFVSRDVAEFTRPELTSAAIVVSGGRGLNSAENYRAVLEPLAEKLNAGLGASRAAVDSGFAPNHYQVGQTGKVVAPDLYIAVGISGAIQHLAGMKDSKTIVAINKDEEAPIFSVADYGLVGDLFSIVPELTATLDV